MTVLSKVIFLFSIIFSIARANAADIPGLVRELNSLQNKLVSGDLSVQESLAQKFEIIGKTLEEADPAIFLEEKNARSIIVYLLCGGETKGLRQKIDAAKISEKINALLSDSLAYAEGKNGGVPERLMEVDPKTLPHLVGAHLALIQAGALIGKNDRRAMDLLDIARLFMPGSLVEEAALRRQIAILDPTEDVDKFARLSLRYVSLYGRSPYAKNFWDVIQHSTIQDEEVFARAEKFQAIIDRAPSPIKIAANLDLARQALNEGKFEKAQDAIDRAASAVDDPAARKRVDFYKLILAALREQKTSQDLEKIDRVTLDKTESTLVGMTTSIVTALSARNEKQKAQGDDVYEMSANARRAITETDDLLKRSANR